MLMTVVKKQRVEVERREGCWAKRFVADGPFVRKEDMLTTAKRSGIKGLLTAGGDGRRREEDRASSSVT